MEPAAFEIKARLVAHYDANAAEREQRGLRHGREDFRDRFARLLHEEGRAALLELGAGTGEDALGFIERGLEVVAIDLSPEHVAACRSKGIDARIGDFYQLDLPSAAFDAGWAMSSLLHVPDRDFDQVLAEIVRILRPGSPIGIGLWGGFDYEGPWGPADRGGARFYSLRSDARVRGMLEAHGDVEEFSITVYDADPEAHYQWAILRTRGGDTE